MELQLAEGQHKKLSYTPYIWIPNIQAGGGVYAREDKFDDMSEDDYDEFMYQIAPHEMNEQNLSEGEFLSMLASRKSRRAERQQAKKEKKAAQTDKKKSKADARRLKAEAKKTKAEKGKSGKGAEFFNKALDTTEEYLKTKNAGGGDGGADDGSGGGAADTTEKKSNTMYWVIGGAAAVLIIGGVVVSSMNKKGKAA